MRRDHRRQAGGARQRHQRVEDVQRGVWVEIAGRLVGQQHARRIGDGAADGDALLLAARQFARQMVEPIA